MKRLLFLSVLLLLVPDLPAQGLEAFTSTPNPDGGQTYSLSIPVPGPFTRRTVARQRPG